ncbi:hypothetical protein WF834_10070 [Faecalibacterium sp. HTF-128]|uniref:HEPN AbiJ-N-terminal domain-containing protein n=1 Tax=Faecalibacterium wellingii TaxID=2929491 RepID=A0AB35Y578_9FIRM
MSENERKSMIRVRGGFSERNRIIHFGDVIQTTEFEYFSRVALCNCMYDFMSNIFEVVCSPSYSLYPEYPSSFEAAFCKDMIRNVFHEHDECSQPDSYSWNSIYTSVRDVITDAPYNEVLDIIEYICNYLAPRSGAGTIYQKFNDLFEQECIGYRFISKRIVPITDNSEVKEIEQACHTPFEGARTQLQKALGFLSDRENPDYKNSIKESISAVESVCETIVGSDNGATLGKAVKHLEEHGLKIHSSLREGISKLYGYACDQGGVRHGEGEVESTVTFEEAKLMMVTCSAIVNYLVSEYGKHGAENA